MSSTSPVGSVQRRWTGCTAPTGYPPAASSARDASASVEVSTIERGPSAPASNPAIAGLARSGSATVISSMKLAASGVAGVSTIR